MSLRKETRQSANEYDVRKVFVEYMPNVSLDTQDSKMQTLGVQSVDKERGFWRCKALSSCKSLPSRLNNSKTNDSLKQMMSLNENHLSSWRERSKTFTASPKGWYEQTSPSEHKNPQSKMRETGASNCARYSPQVTVTYKNQYEQFLEQNRITETGVTYGRVKIMFQYSNEDTEFRLTLLRARNVTNGTVMPVRVYAKVCLIPETRQKKFHGHKYNSSNPVFNEQFRFRTSLGNLMESKLRIKLYNKPGRFSLPKSLAICTIDLSKYDLTSATVMWEDLTKGNCEKNDELNLKQSKKKSRRRWKSLLCATKC